jgi:hypothetical protein
MVIRLRRAGILRRGVVYASNDLIAKNPEAIRAFVAAWIETTDYMRAQPTGRAAGACQTRCRMPYR